MKASIGFSVLIRTKSPVRDWQVSCWASKPDAFGYSRRRFMKFPIAAKVLAYLILLQEPVDRNDGMMETFVTMFNVFFFFNLYINPRLSHSF